MIVHKRTYFLCFVDFWTLEASSHREPEHWSVLGFVRIRKWDSAAAEWLAHAYDCTIVNVATFLNRQLMIMTWIQRHVSLACTASSACSTHMLAWTLANYLLGKVSVVESQSASRKPLTPFSSNSLREADLLDSRDFELHTGNHDRLINHLGSSYPNKEEVSIPRRFH